MRLSSVAPLIGLKLKVMPPSPGKTEEMDGLLIDEPQYLMNLIVETLTVGVVLMVTPRGIQAEAAAVLLATLVIKPLADAS